MTSLNSVSIFLVVFVISVASGCTNQSTKAPDVTASIRQALDQAGLKDVSVSQDRDKNLITLTGKVASDNDKMQAESIARSIARDSSCIQSDIRATSRRGEHCEESGVRPRPRN